MPGAADLAPPRKIGRKIGIVAGLGALIAVGSDFLADSLKNVRPREEWQPRGRVD